MWLVRIGNLLPFGTFDGILKKMTGLDLVAARVEK